MEKQSTGSVIRKNILLNYPGAVLYGLLFNVMLMLDSIIAGWNLGADGIAAVALGVPGYGVFSSAIYALVHGCGLRMIWAKGRADDLDFRRAFSGGATLVGLCGLAFAILIFAFAEGIVLVCGGDMVDAAVRHYAVIYLGFCAPIVFFTALGKILQEIMNVLGFQTARASLNAINVTVNLTVSILCISVFPADMKLAGLGIGTSAGGLMEFIGGIILLRHLKVDLKYRPLILRPKEILETIRCGFPAAADYFAESIVMVIQNNLILSGFPGNKMILPVTEVVCNISYFASGTIKGAAIAAEPLFGVFYEAHDVKSIKKVWQHGWAIGAALSVVWAVLFYVSSPLLSALCGMALTPDISRGVLLCMVFTPAMHTVYMFTLYYEATKHFNLSIAFATVPDSCLYVLMMAALIPVLGKDGIWLAITGNQVIGLILLIPLVLFIAAKTGRNTDRLLLLPDEFYAGTTLLEFELSGDGTDRTSTIERLREPLRSILLEPGKTDAVMSCARELVSDMLETSNHIHITLREKEEKAELFIRSLGQQRALPASISDSVTAWENGSISYSYAYKMNIVYITLAS
ncbi:MAG: hypothetical protein IJT77_03400 [Clostridia bacterium]|nr:hypothetical protein [Clostridia bacterium]